MFRPIGSKRLLDAQEIALAASYFSLGKVVRATLLRSGNINTNYRLTTSRGHYLLRIYTLSDEKGVRSEVKLLRTLAKRGFSAPRPVEGKKDHLFFIDALPVCCFKYIEGHRPRTTLATIRRIGALTGELHGCTQGYRGNYQKEGEGLAAMRRLCEQAREPLIDGGFADAQKFIMTIRRELASIRFRGNLPSGIVHVDIKRENVLVREDGTLALIDFDNAYEDALIIDVGSCLLWWCMEQERLDVKKARIWLEGYETRRQLSHQERTQLLRALEFNLLKGALKYAYICLPRKRFAEERSSFFLRCHENMKREREEYKKMFLDA